MYSCNIHIIVWCVWIKGDLKWKRVDLAEDLEKLLVLENLSNENTNNVHEDRYQTKLIKYSFLEDLVPFLQDLQLNLVSNKTH